MKRFEENLMLELQKRFRLFFLKNTSRIFILVLISFAVLILPFSVSFNPTFSFNLNWLQKNDWLTLFGLLGGVISVIGLWVTLLIYRESKKESDTTKQLVEEIQKISSSISKNTEQLKDALRKRPEMLENIFPEFKIFLHELEEKECDEIYILTDTLAFGRLHLEFNESLKEKYPNLKQDLRDIDRLLQDLVSPSEASRKEPKCTIGMIKFPSAINLSHQNSETNEAILKSRLMEKCIKPILDEISEKELSENPNASPFMIEEDLTSSNSRIKKFLELHEGQKKRYNSYNNKAIVELRELPYQLYIGINSMTHFYAAFIVYVGTYNMEAVSEASAMITYDRGFVETQRSFFKAYVEKAQKKEEEHRKKDADSALKIKFKEKDNFQD